MSLPETMYGSLRDEKLPRLYPAKTTLETARSHLKTVRFRRDRLLNTAVKVVKPLRTVKGIAVEGTNFSGYRMILRNAYVSKYGDELKYKAQYKNQRSIPLMGKITQKMNGAERIVHVLFMPMAPYETELSHVLDEPKALSCSAEVTAETGLIRYDSVSERFNVGLFDDRYKPADEYPVQGADNAVLDIGYDFRVTNMVYPLPLPSGLSFEGMPASYRSGFLLYEGKRYTDPAVNNTIRVAATVRNNVGATIRIVHWGFPLSVLYEDNRRVSQIDVSVSFPARDIVHGATYSYYLDFNLPGWNYGKICAAHAMRVYKAGMPIYFGGPMWCLECFRLRLP